MHKPAKLTQFSVVGVSLICLSLLLARTTIAQTATEPVVEPPVTEAPTQPTPTPQPEVVRAPFTTPSPSTEVKLVAIPARYGDTEETQLLLKPGQKQQINLRVNNDSDKPITIKSMAEDFIIDADGSTPIPVEGDETDNRWSMAKWVTVTPGLQTIKPKSTVGVSVTIEVPEDALPGGRYVMVMHQADTGQQVTQPGETTNVINQRVGTLLYGLVDGPIIESAFIRNLTVPQLSEFGPIPYSFRVDNESDVHIHPKLSAKIYNLWGKEVSSSTIDSKNIFPKSYRDFQGEWERIWGLGRYRLEISMIYGTLGTATVMASAYFWIIPIKLILAIALGLLTIFAIIILIRRHLIHRKNDQAKKVKELEEKVAQLEKTNSGE